MGVNAFAFDPKKSSTLYVGVQAHPDVFVTKLDPAGAVVYSTYLGGRQYESSLTVAVDAAGNAHAAGVTRLEDFPVVRNLSLFYRGGCQRVCFEAGPGGGVSYSTVLGTQRGFDANGIALDPEGNLYVTGWTGLASMPVVGGLGFYNTPAQAMSLS